MFVYLLNTIIVKVFYFIHYIASLSLTRTYFNRSSSVE